MKRQYMKPTMHVVLLQHETQLLINSVNNTEGFVLGDIAPEEVDV